MLLHPQVVNKLSFYAQDAAPNEAVGLLDGVGKIFLLDNISESPGNSFVVNKEQIVNTMNRPHFTMGTDLVLWHSHPSGLVGPSRTDMQQKTPFKHHLIVTIFKDDIKLTWY